MLLGSQTFLLHARFIYETLPVQFDLERSLTVFEVNRMRQSLILAGVTGLAITAALLSFRPTIAQPSRDHSSEDAPPSRSVSLPVGQVVLFSSGVGYFQREGTVEGDARVDLSFPVTDINDLLKSMVLRDLSGGHVSAVSYESNAPVERTLKSFAINLTGGPGFGQIINQARGEKVEVSLLQNNAGQPATLTGTIVGIEKQKVVSGKDPGTEIEILNLWCSDGVRSLKLNEVARLRFLNPVIESEFRKALETLALSHDQQKKAVSVHFSGQGKREVRVGYVVENPIWKTSYRLVLDKKEKPYLQGWAVVENSTDEDWKDVRMALVSGRPISFQMDLYTPLFVPRPTVELEQFASLRPPTYSGGLGMAGFGGGMGGPGGAIAQAADGAKSPPGGAAPVLNAPAAPAARPYRDLQGGENDALRSSVRSVAGEKALTENLSLEGSVNAAATAAKLGDFFQYVIDRPVNLGRQKSALLPIVTKEIDARRVSIYNEQTQAKFPLLGLKLKNSSGMHLMQGPITVFDGSNYAGDSRILDIQPNEERLISYAIDLGTEVNPVPSADNGRIVMVKALKGIVETTTKLRETKTYTIANRNDSERLVLIEHPVRNAFKLIETDKPAETASDFYRFQVKVAPGTTEKQVVTEERVINQQVDIRNINDDQIRFFISQTASSPRVKAGLKQALEMRWTVSKTRAEIGELEKQLKIIVDDQTRLRANLKEMPSTAAAYARYLKKFDDQESVIEKFQADIKRLQGTQFAQQKEFDNYLANFNAE